MNSKRKSRILDGCRVAHAVAANCIKTQKSLPLLQSRPIPKPQRCQSADGSLYYSITILRAPVAVTTTYTPLESTGIPALSPP